MRIALISNTAWSLFNFRKGLITRLIAEGHHVIAVAPKDEYSDSLCALGAKYCSIGIDNKGVNPALDLVLLLKLAALLRREKIDLALLYTIKPVIYGSLACRILSIPVISVITGLGTAFLREGLLKRLVKMLYWVALKGVYWVFFLNEDDKSLFIENRLVKNINSSKIPGEGVDLNYFSPVSITNNNVSANFLFAGRLLRDKGVLEYINAARAIKQKYPLARFDLLGFVGVPNQSAINMDQLSEWIQEGVVNYLGATADVRAHIANADCFILPSYREGVSRALLEAMAMARPIISTDVVGCRELVEDGVNGFLCMPRDVESLIHAIERFILMDCSSRAEMGCHGRKKVSREYSEDLVISMYLDKINNLNEYWKK